MRRSSSLLAAALLVMGGLFLSPGPASAQVLTCVIFPPNGPPQDVPATITGAGTLVGTPGDDIIAGSTGPDSIFGLGGNDSICGRGGNDRLVGGDGDDFIDGDNPSGGPFGGPIDSSPHVDVCRGNAGLDVLNNCEIAQQ